MRSGLLRPIAVFFVLLAFMLMGKPVFLLTQEGMGLESLWDVWRHGLAMDASVAGYLTAVPWLMAVTGLLVKLPKWVARGYFILTATVLALIYCADVGLYPYWGFRLDMTPLFYLVTSPGAAMASLPWWGWLLGAVAVAALAGALAVALIAVWERIPEGQWRKGSGMAWTGLGYLAVAACLFIFMRGGVTVSTMNPGRAYFCDDLRLNQAAQNPAFTLLHSATHQHDFERQFRFFEPAEAEEIVARLRGTVPTEPAIEWDWSGGMPDIHVILLESFSTALFPSMGGEPVALGLDSIAQSGWTFTNFYASSVRTDRALAAVFASYPGTPNTSLLKFPEKLREIPCWPEVLAKRGYENAYYYGGDVNFTNMKALLHTCSFGRIVADTDFPVGERLSKWGVHDHLVFGKALEDREKTPRRGPRLTVVQTSSSHEPFEVPYQRHPDKRVNAFMYTDSCATAYVNALREGKEWENSLVIILGDHYGCYPEQLEGELARHHIPLILTGGCIEKRQRPESALLSTPGSQTDLGTTILAILGVRERLPFSHDLLQESGFAFFSSPSEATLVTRGGDGTEATAALDVATKRVIAGGESSEGNALRAYLQVLYGDLGRR